MYGAALHELHAHYAGHWGAMAYGRVSSKSITSPSISPHHAHTPVATLSSSSGQKLVSKLVLKYFLVYSMPDGERCQSAMLSGDYLQMRFWSLVTTGLFCCPRLAFHSTTFPTSTRASSRIRTATSLPWMTRPCTGEADTTREWHLKSPSHSGGKAPSGLKSAGTWPWKSWRTRNTTPSSVGSVYHIVM